MASVGRTLGNKPTTMGADFSGGAFQAVTLGDLEALQAIVAADPSVSSVRDRDGLSLVLQAVYRGRANLSR